MAWQRLPGNGLMVPSIPFNFANGSGFTASSSLTAAGHKYAIVGDFCHKDKTGSKNITKIHTRIGANSSFVGTLTGYVQGVSTTSGPPATPDGSTTSGATFSTLTAATWQTTGAFSTAYTASVGSRIAVVFDVTAFTSGSIAPTSGVTALALQTAYSHSPQILLNTASWAIASNNLIPNVILECDDGTFGTIEGCLPCEAESSVAYNVNTAAADEYALRMVFPFPVKIDAAWASIAAASAVSDFSFVLYADSTATKTIDGNQVTAASANRFVMARFDNEYSLAANTVGYLSLRVDGTTNMSLFYFDVNNSAHFQAHDGGENFYMVDRVNAGAWGTTNSNSGKRRPLMGVRISSLDDGTGGGGGLALPVSGRIIA